MSLRTYEALYIVRPDLEDDAIQTVARNVEKLIVDNGGETVRLDIWGKRRLAYRVKKHMEGCYVLFRFQASPAVIPKLEMHIRLSENIIRHLIVYFDDQTLRLEAEQLRRKEEEIRSGGAGRGGWGDRDRDRGRDDDEFDEDDDDMRGRRGRRGGHRGDDRHGPEGADDEDLED